MEHETCPGCGKPVFMSWDQARTAARKVAQYDDPKGKRRRPMSVYRGSCGSIHLTSQKRKDRREPTKRKVRRPKRGR